jgi:hypothetical protein
MIRIKFITIFIVILISYSCDKKCYRDITDEEKSRLAYKGGEVVVFKSNLGAYDTLAITGGIKKSYNPKDEHCTDENYSLGVWGIFKNKLNSQLYSIQFSTSVSTPKKRDKDLVYPKISTEMGYFTINKGTILTSININGKQLYNVYEMTNSSRLPAFNVDKIYFSFEYGLLKIVLHDGTYWERINF